MNDCEEDTISLPSNDSTVMESEDQPEIKYYMVRLTPGDSEPYTKGDLKKFLEQQFSDDQWVVGVELLPKVHYHVVVKSTETFENFKLIFRTQIYLWYPKRERGFGIKQWHCQVGKQNLKRAISYTIKDKIDHFYFGFDEMFILECLQDSFQKNTPSNFRLEYFALCHDFEISDNDMRTFMVDLCVLKAKYRQKVNLKDIEDYAQMCIIRREGRKMAENLVENYLYNKKW